MKKILILSYIFFMMTGLSAQGVITNVKGKVEIMSTGSNWVEAKVNSKVSLATQISTGFNSQATISLNNNIIVIKPLTRMSLGEYSQLDGLTTTTLKLTAGRVRVNVNSTEERKNNFRVQSPVATASVRGTVFEFDGFRLEVEEGTVEYVTPQGARVSITQGGASELTKDNGLTTQEQTDMSSSEVAMVASPQSTGSNTLPANPKDTVIGTKGSLLIRVE